RHVVDALVPEHAQFTVGVGLVLEVDGVALAGSLQFAFSFDGVTGSDFQAHGVVRRQIVVANAGLGERRAGGQFDVFVKQADVVLFNTAPVIAATYDQIDVVVAA